MAATRRIKKELAEVRDMGLHTLRKLQVNEDNILTWYALIVPDDRPYNKGAFKIEINFPLDYPFRPPKLFFHTQIYHPNIDEQGYVCLPIIMSDYWRPSTRMVQVITAVIALVSNPDPHYALRSDAAEELLRDKRKFMITAEAHTIKNALPRPKERFVPPPTTQAPVTSNPENIQNPESSVQHASQENNEGQVSNEESSERQSSNQNSE